jgi:hypothetical protein
MDEAAETIQAALVAVSDCWMNLRRPASLLKGSSPCAESRGMMRDPAAFVVSLCTNPGDYRSGVCAAAKQILQAAESMAEFSSPVVGWPQSERVSEAFLLLSAIADILDGAGQLRSP